MKQRFKGPIPHVLEAIDLLTRKQSGGGFLSIRLLEKWSHRFRDMDMAMAAVEKLSKDEHEYYVPMLDGFTMGTTLRKKVQGLKEVEEFIQDLLKQKIKIEV